MVWGQETYNTAYKSGNVRFAESGFAHIEPKDVCTSDLYGDYRRNAKELNAIELVFGEKLFGKAEAAGAAKTRADEARKEADEAAKAAAAAGAGAAAESAAAAAAAAQEAAEAEDAAKQAAKDSGFRAGYPTRKKLQEIFGKVSADPALQESSMPTFDDNEFCHLFKQTAAKARETCRETANDPRRRSELTAAIQLLFTSITLRKRRMMKLKPQVLKAAAPGDRTEDQAGDGPRKKKPTITQGSRKEELGRNVETAEAELEAIKGLIRALLDIVPACDAVQLCKICHSDEIKSDDSITETARTMVRISCGHQYCARCFIHHIHTKTRNGSIIMCPFCKGRDFQAVDVGLQVAFQLHTSGKDAKWFPNISKVEYEIGIQEGFVPARVTEKTLKNWNTSLMEARRAILRAVSDKQLVGEDDCPFKTGQDALEAALLTAKQDLESAVCEAVALTHMSWLRCIRAKGEDDKQNSVRDLERAIELLESAKRYPDGTCRSTVCQHLVKTKCTLGLLHLHRRDIDQANRVFALDQETIKGIGSLKIEGDVYGNMGLAAYASGDFDKACEAYRQQLDRYTRAEEPVTKGEVNAVRLNIAVLELVQGYAEKCREYLEACGWEDRKTYSCLWRAFDKMTQFAELEALRNRTRVQALRTELDSIQALRTEPYSIQALQTELDSIRNEHVRNQAEHTVISARLRSSLGDALMEYLGDALTEYDV